MPTTEPSTAQRAATAADPFTLRPQGLADRLGVSRRHIYDLIDHPDPARRLPAPFKMGRATFWKMSDISTWIERQSARTAA
jgi:predicted DNA-binding transcriptional regulator AlpA